MESGSHPSFFIFYWIATNGISFKYILKIKMNFYKLFYSYY